MQNEIWFHGQINRADAERLLRKDGDFLVRESPNSEGQYVLSGMQGDTKKHLLLIDPEGIVGARIMKPFNGFSDVFSFFKGTYKRQDVQQCQPSHQFSL